MSAQTSLQLQLLHTFESCEKVIVNRIAKKETECVDENRWIHFIYLNALVMAIL